MREKNIAKLTPFIAALKRNRSMLKLAESLGFKIEAHPEDDSVRYISRKL